MGKGSAPRPFSVSKDAFDKNFEAIFGKKETNKQDTKENDHDLPDSGSSGQDKDRLHIEQS